MHEAKKSAEVAPGVGKFTDIGIIHNGKIFELGDEALKVLEKVHKEKPALSEDELAQIKKVSDDAIATPNKK